MNTSPNIKLEPYAVGDTVETRKPHPCGGVLWEILRVGADIRMKCLKCGHSVMLPRTKFDKMIKAVQK